MPKGLNTVTRKSGVTKKGVKWSKTKKITKAPKRGFSSDEAKLKSQALSGKTARAMAYTTTANRALDNVAQSVSSKNSRDEAIYDYINSIINDSEMGQNQRAEDEIGTEMEKKKPLTEG